MNKRVKRCLSVLLAVVMVVAITVPTVGAVEVSKDELKQKISDLASADMAAKAYRYAVENGYVEQLKQAVAQAKAKLEQVDLSKIEITEQQREELKAKLALVRDALEQADAALKADDVDAAVAALKNLAKELAEGTVLENLIGEPKKALELVKEKLLEIEQLYAELAMHGEYLKGAYYVAITGETNGYVANFAEARKLTYQQMTWDNIDWDEIAKAGLITVGYDMDDVDDGVAFNQMMAYMGNYVENELQKAIDDYVATLQKAVEDYVTETVIKELTEEVTGKVLEEGGTQTDVDEALAGEEFKNECADAIKEVLESVDLESTIGDKVNEKLEKITGKLDGYEMQELDWSKLGIDNAAEYVSRVETKLRSVLANRNLDTYTFEVDVLNYAGLDASYVDGLRERMGDDAKLSVEIPVVDFACYAAEAYLYTIADFNLAYARTVLKIAEVNPDATVVLLSNNNIFKTVGTDTELIDLDAAYDLVERVIASKLGITITRKSLTANVAGGMAMEAMNVQALTYALALDNVIFVDVSDAQIKFETEEGVGDNLTALVISFLKNKELFVATDAGNTYMAERIAAALCCDENSDHYCDYHDEQLSDHIGGVANCHSGAICDYCGQAYGEKDPTNHDGGTEIRNAKAATKTEAGYTGDTHCLGCGEKLAEGKVIPATGTTEPDPTEPNPTEPDPTEPDPTEPRPTEPDPTEPDPTEPQPTEPDPTEPDPTEPDPTEPDPTEPDPTEPDPTEPNPTEPDPTEPQPTQPEEPVDDEGGLSTGAIVAIVVGSLVVLGGAGYLAFFLIKKRKIR